jgi:hypothetical protein
MIIATSANAGLYNLSVVIINIGDSAFYETANYKEFSQSFSQKSNSCWKNLGNEIDSLEHISRVKRPDGLTRTLGLSIWSNDRKSIDFAFQIMLDPKFDGKKTEYGPYDGLFVINPEKNKLSVMAIGHWHSDSREMEGAPKKITVQLDKNPKKAALQFEKALCAAASYNVKNNDKHGALKGKK